MTPDGDTAGAAPPPAPWLSEDSIWQLVESGSYRVDLAAWSRIADGTASAVLDLGCGTGRVAHHLAREGHRVLGIERDPGIAADFNRGSPDPATRAIPGDVLAPPPAVAGEGPFDRIIAPQQLIQILGGRTARRRLLAGVAALLSPGGRVAFALAPVLPDRSLELDLLPDLREIGGWVYSSRPVSIEAAADRVEVTRLRNRVSPEGALAESSSVVGFDRLGPDRLAAELAEASLRPEGTVPLPATAEHVASVIVTARREPGAA